MTALAGVLLETSLAASAAVLAVLALRRPVRRLLGARAAYGLWWLVPVSLVAVLLPSPRIETPVTIAPMRSAEATAAAPVAVAPARVDPGPWLAAAWGLGVLVVAGSLAQRQRRFRRALGDLLPRPDGSWRAASSHAGPAVIGALRGRIVLPADFDRRYTPLQRELVLRHERVHVARFDAGANLFAAALRCLHWFNPLLPLAAPRFRFDQELAADALVLAQRPEARRDYADAMLATSLLAEPPPLGCHWQPAHPLKERILMLKHPLPGATRRRLGLALVLGLALSAGYTAWAAQPARAVASGMTFDESFKGLRVLLTVGDQPVQLLEHIAQAGEKQSLVQDSDGFAFAYEITAADEQEIELTGTVTHRGKVLSQPTLRFARGERTRLTLAGAEHGLPVDATYDFFYGTGRELRGEPRPNLGSADRIDVSYARLAPPAYPQAAIGEKKEGTVLLRVQVGTDGSPRTVELERSSGDARLDESARSKVADWRFNAAKEKGVAVESWVVVPVTFALDGGAAVPGKPALPAGALDEIHINAPKD